ncbi:unnamed protein product [Euphydryas editha]|uniref:Uncharacterized protein n=1 Tax=Euphydryas editha TaxID=104508 RepID=A0AAU9UMQ0_EUPED|nr:unnamed protein product [Euphydryas editha]
MDDTQASLKASEAAAATRKRRSSILKSQRPPRTPLSEVFNVATPTDTAKSRRVSFSRRTGVAEFVTNEATTTWKNFYEEHNKSLESSGNESAANAPRPPSIGHIGKRIFDQQFEEVEYVDIGGTLQTNTAVQEFQTSLNNVNLTQQLAALECTGDDRKLCAPTQNFDLSPLTDHHSKVFGDEFSIPVMTEMTNPINIDFSNLQPMSSNSKLDDLEEIQRDLKRSNPSNVVCQGPFSGRDLSEYIEIDLNMTNFGVRSDDCDMSITDMIQSPKVQEIVKSNTSIVKDKKISVNDDLVVDKENIAYNPYAAPKESLNFAINEASNEVLVFDGKKLTVQLEKQAIDLDNQNVPNKTPTATRDTATTPKRKTIVLNTNDDLPNFIPSSSVMVNQCYNLGSKDIAEAKHSVVYNDFDLSLTQAVDNKKEILKRQTIVFNDDTGDVSITQAVPSKVIIEKEEMRKTILYENNDLPNISMTQALPSNIISANKSVVEKRKTIVFEDGDISITRALPTNLILDENTNLSKNKTVYFQNGLDISVTQAIPENILTSNTKNLESVKNDLTNLSITQAISSNIISNEIKNNVENTVYYGQDAEIETTQAVSDNALLSNKSKSEKRKTIVYEQDAGNISITQAVPTNILFDIKNKVLNTNASTAMDKSLLNSENNCEKVRKSKQDLMKNETIYNVEPDVSLTKVIATNILQSTEGEYNNMEITSCDNDISITRALPTNILSQGEEQNMNEILEPANKTNTTILIEKDNKIENKDVLNATANISKVFQKSQLYTSDLSNLSLTKPIPTEILTIQNDLSKSEMDMNESLFKVTNISTVNQDILVYQTAEQNITKSNDINRSYTKIEDEMCSNISLEKNNESVKHDLSDTFNQSVSIKESNNKSLNYSLKKQNEHEETELETKCLNETELLSVSVQQSHTVNKSAVVHIEQNVKPKKSIINELLDMSCASLDDVGERPELDKIEADISGMKMIKDNINTTFKKESNDSIFVIKDSESDMNTEEIKDHCIKDTTSNKKSPKICYEPLNKEESEQELLQQKVDDLKLVVEENRKSLNRHYEQVLSSDLRKSVGVLDKSNVNNDQNISRGKKSFHNADDTKELLQMLSDITDSHNDKQEKNNSLPVVDIKASTSLENKSEPMRFSIIPKRQSIALSREDLLTSISMAQAALQQSRFEIDESECMEDTRDSSEDEEDFETKQAPRKSVRMSTDVVKTLQFEEDDSVVNVSTNERSPLKKTTFGDVSYIKEDKARVIPTYLKDVSDGIKALMHDLVKPMPDMMPHENAEINDTKTSPSTCSTQIQANLITSSQIDIDVELRSTPESVDNIESNQSIVTEVAAIGNKAVTHALRQSIKPVSPHVALEIEQKSTIDTIINTSVARQSISGPVIVFDHSNPLNNILLTQTECIKVHKYNPLSSDTEEIEKSIEEKNKLTKVEVENVSVHYNIESQISPHQSNVGDNKTFDSKSIDSNISKPLSVDRSTEGIVRDVKDTEVNTLIAMKGNQDLLESNSSLTLVDDALTHPAFDVKVESDGDIQKSPLQVIYKMDTDDDQLHKIDSDFTSNDDFEKEDFNENNTNTRKRSYSPTKQDKHRLSKPIEVTPKPLSKMQKISNSPQAMKNKDREQSKSPKIEPNVNEKSPNKSKLSPEKRSPKKRNSTKREEMITVQQLITECYKDSAIDKKIDKHILQALRDVPSESLVTETLSRTIGAKSVDTVSESSAKETEDTGSVESRTISVVGSNVSREDWQPEVIDELSSKNLLTECSSSVNVVAKINTLSFMGSRDCEWESSGGDVWMFRLLRTHVRLTVRLAHSHHNASRSRVRADTALVAVTVESVKEEKDPLAELCVRLAAEAMRCESSRCARAGDVPALLRRCVAVARVAPLWARVMRDARLRLAYSVTPDGDLTLKVANVPLRAVWEVRLRVALAADARGAFPRASLGRVSAVLGARAPPAARLQRLAERARADWGHAPDALWKIFRYLKNKTREDDLLGL